MRRRFRAVSGDGQFCGARDVRFHRSVIGFFRGGDEFVRQPAGPDQSARLIKGRRILRQDLRLFDQAVIPGVRGALDDAFNRSSCSGKSCSLTRASAMADLNLARRETARSS
jgi:hypothetical protein